MTLKGPFLLWTPCLYISNMGDNEEEYKFSVEEQMEDYVDVDIGVGGDVVDDDDDDDDDDEDFQLKSRGKTVGGAEDHLGSFFIALPLIRKGYRNITLQVDDVMIVMKLRMIMVLMMILLRIMMTRCTDNLWVSK